MSQVVLKMSAFSNITYRNEYETGYTKEEWDELSDKRRDDIITEAVFEDIDVWEVVREDGQDGDDDDVDF